MDYVALESGSQMLSATLIDNFRARLVSVDQRRQVFERLLFRNHVRHQIGIKPIDIPTAYYRKVHTLEKARYEELLEPYLTVAFGAVDWPAGLGGRLLIAVRLHKKCVDQVHSDHGIRDPRSTKPDFIALLDRLVGRTPDTVVRPFVAETT